MAISSKQTQERTVWMWKSNINPLPDIESDEWKRYSDIENCIIELAYQQNKNDVELDDFWIDFKHQIEINKINSNNQRSIKRVVNMSNGYVREERFTLEEPNLTSKSFSTKRGDFLHAAGFNVHTQLSEELVERAASGIEQEGMKLGKQKEAEWMANELRKVKHKGKKEISECCVKLYTMESFLYKLINKVMREAEIGGLGGSSTFVSETYENYGWLLNTYLYDIPQEKDTSVFRSATLTNEMIDDYKKYVGKMVR